MCVCVCLFVCSPPRLLITSGTIWTPYDWLNKFYSCYIATVVVIVNGHCPWNWYKLLWKRFQQLGPDKSGHVDKAVFSKSEVYSNIFCKQVSNVYNIV